MSEAGIATRPDSLTPRVTDAAVAMPACPNCGSAQVADFCAQCGERQPSQHDYSVRGMVLDAFHEFTSLDGRLLRSIVALVARPGLLTREWFAGRRGRYVKPFSLFVVLNLVFFIVQPHTGLLRYDYGDYVNGDGDAELYRQQVLERRFPTAISNPSPAFAARFDATLQDQKKSLLVVCIPIVAVVLALTFLGQGRYFVEHLVFSLHLYTFFLIFATLVTPLYMGAFAILRPLGVGNETLRMLGGQTALILVMSLVLGTYTVLAIRRVYGSRLVPAFARALVLVFAQQFLIVAYHDLLFYTTLYSL